MKPLCDLFVEYLKSDEIKFFSEPADDAPQNTDYMCAFETATCDVVLKTHVDEDQRSIRICSSVGLRVPKERFVDVSRWLAEMNHSLIVGFFVVSPMSREIELLVTAAFAETTPSAMCLRRLFETAIYCMSQNYEAILETLRGPRRDAGPSSEMMDEVLARLMGSSDDAASPEIPGDSEQEAAKKPARRRRQKSDDQ